MNADIKAFNEKQESSDREICELLSAEIDKRLPKAQSKIWHDRAGALVEEVARDPVGLQKYLQDQREVEAHKVEADSL